MDEIQRAPTIRVRRKVYQENGDGMCFSACIASLMGLRLADVPCFWDRADITDQTEHVGMVQSAKDWLQSMGYVWWELKWDRDDLGTRHEPCPCIVSGKSPRGIMHAIVCEFFVMGDGEDGRHAVQMIHDPHRSGAGVVEPLWIGFLLPLHHRPRRGKVDSPPSPTIVHE